MNYFYVYILHCSDGSYYTGHTDNIEKRIAEHKAGQGGGYTSQRLPVQLVFFQPTETRERAFELERKIKKWNKGKKERSGSYQIIRPYC